MQPYALSSQNQVIRRNQNTTRYSSIKKGLGPVSHALFVALMVAILGLMYLTQITKTTAYGYEVDELKTAKSALIEENEQLEVESARLQALERIRTSDVAKSLSDVGAVEFTNSN